MKAKSRTASSEAANLRRGDPRALHEQLSARLRTEFVATHPPGEQLPTEEAICQTYGLSRVTVRRAIQTLVDQGLLIRRQGKGTFIAPPRPHITYEIDRLGPFMDAFAASGEQVTAHLVDFYWGTEKQVPECFAPAQSVLLYERLYETGGTPHGFLQIAIPPHLGERISKADTACLGVYQILRERLGVEPYRASFNISSALPTLQSLLHARGSAVDQRVNRRFLSRLERSRLFGQGKSRQSAKSRFSDTIFHRSYLTLKPRCKPPVRRRTSHRCRILALIDLGLNSWTRSPTTRRTASTIAPGRPEAFKRQRCEIGEPLIRSAFTAKSRTAASVLACFDRSQFGNGTSNTNRDSLVDKDQFYALKPAYLCSERIES